MTQSVPVVDGDAVFGELSQLWPAVALSAAVWTVLYHISPFVSDALFPVSHRRIRNDKRVFNSWHVHMVSQVHCIPVVLIAFSQLFSPVLINDRLFGRTQISTAILIYSAGYFLWDAIVSLIHIKSTGVGFVIHAVSCTLLYGLALRPWLHYYGMAFLLFELSTPFVNNHWFYDKCNMSGSKGQFVNGVFLLSAYFLVRIIFGFVASSWFWADLLELRASGASKAPAILVFVYLAFNIVLNGLNLFWFYSIISMAMRRTSGGTGAKGKEAN